MHQTSQDLSPLGGFLWNEVGQLFYKNTYYNIGEFKKAIETASIFKKI